MVAKHTHTNTQVNYMGSVYMEMFYVVHICPHPPSVHDEPSPNDIFVNRIEIETENIDYDSNILLEFRFRFRFRFSFFDLFRFRFRFKYREKFRFISISISITSPDQQWYGMATSQVYCIYIASFHRIISWIMPLLQCGPYCSAALIVVRPLLHCGPYYCGPYWCGLYYSAALIIVRPLLLRPLLVRPLLQCGPYWRGLFFAAFFFAALMAWKRIIVYFNKGLALEKIYLIRYLLGIL